VGLCALVALASGMSFRDSTSVYCPDPLVPGKLTRRPHFGSLAQGIYRRRTVAHLTKFFAGGALNVKQSISKYSVTPFVSTSSNQACCIMGRSFQAFDMIYALEQCGRLEDQNHSWATGEQGHHLCGMKQARAFSKQQPAALKACCIAGPGTGLGASYSRGMCLKIQHRAKFYFEIGVVPDLSRCLAVMSTNYTARLPTGGGSGITNPACAKAVARIAEYSKELHVAASVLYEQTAMDPKLGRTKYMTRYTKNLLQIRSLRDIIGFLHMNDGLPAKVFPQGFTPQRPPSPIPTAAPTHSPTTHAPTPVATTKLLSRSFRDSREVFCLPVLDPHITASSGNCTTSRTVP
jgi:hypothetical protein